jgi:hypothetical protein
MMPFSMAFGLDAVLVEAAAVVHHLDDDAARIMVGVEFNAALGRLAGRGARGRRLDAVVHGISDQVHQRIADLLHHRFVEFGLGAGDHQFDVLAQLLRDVAGNAMEAVEGFADLHHAQGQRGIADALDQPGEDRGGLDQGAFAALPGQQVGRGAGDHQFAHQVDELVQLVRVDADQAGFGGLLLGYGLLLGGGGFDDLRLHAVLLDQDVAQGRRRRVLGADSFLGLPAQAGVKFLAGQGAALDQDFAQAHGLLGQGLDQAEVLLDLAVGRQDVEVAVVTTEVEHTLDGVLAGVAAEADLESQVAQLRIHRLGIRQGIDQRGHVGDLAEIQQVAQEGQRIHAVFQDIATETDRDMPAVIDGGVRILALDIRLGFGQHGLDGSRLAFAEEGLQGFADRRARRRQIRVHVKLAPGDQVKQGTDVVATQQQCGNHFTADRDLAVAQAVEHVFQDVGEAFHGMDFDHPGAALDGMRGAEHGIDGFGVVIAFFELHQAAFHGFELLAGLDRKHAENFVHCLLPVSLVRRRESPAGRRKRPPC